MTFFQKLCHLGNFTLQNLKWYHVSCMTMHILSFTFSTLSTRISRTDFSYFRISDFRVLKRNVAYTYAYKYTAWRRKRRCTTRRKLVSLSESPSIMTNRTNALEIHRSATQLFVSQREDRERERNET